MPAGMPVRTRIDAEDGPPWRANAAGARQVHLPTVLMAAAGFSVILIAPFAPGAGPEIPGITALFCGGLLISELMTAHLLFGAFRETLRPSVLALACAYAFSGAMTLPYLATFPGAIAVDDSLIGSSQSAAWIMSAWQLGFGGLALAAVVLESEPGQRPMPKALTGPLIVRALAIVGAAVCAITLAALALPETAFAFVEGATWTNLYKLVNIVSTALFTGAIGYGIVRLPRSSELFHWLLVALAVAAAANLIVGIGGGRYSVGWTLARFLTLAGGCVVLCYFLRETVDHRAALARARDRLEHNVAMRTAQLTSMVAERDHLLREVYHRVKNNLQMIDSLIHLHASDLKAESAGGSLADMRRRIHTLALVHERIVSTGANDRIDAGGLLEDICRTRSDATSLERPGTLIAIDPEHATPFALIVSELIACAVGPVGRDGGAVQVRIEPSGPDARLMIAATGAADDPWARLEGAATAGQIVRALTTQIGGEIERPCSGLISLRFRRLTD